MTSGRASARSNADDELLVLEMAKGHESARSVARRRERWRRDFAHSMRVVVRVRLAPWEWRPVICSVTMGHWCSPICSCCHSWPSSDAQRPEIITGSWWWQPAEAAKALQIDLDALFAEALGER